MHTYVNFLGISHAFLPSDLLIFFFKINFSEKKIQKYHLSVEQTGSDQARHFVRPDLGPNCLQRLSVDNTGRVGGRIKLVYTAIQ